MTRPLVRGHGNELFGHTTVRPQLGWCREARVEQAIFTHCESQIVKHDEREMELKLEAMGAAKGTYTHIWPVMTLPSWFASFGQRMPCLVRR